MGFPSEIELSRGGCNEGVGRGFDNVDMSAEGSRVVAVPRAAADAVSWFANQMLSLGWRDRGDGWFDRDEGESFLVRIDRDQGSSRVAALINDAAGKQIQLDAESHWFAGAPADWSVLTLFYLVAPEA